MNKEELMARKLELRKAEEAELQHMLLVDIHVTVDRKPIQELAELVAGELGLKVRFISDMINPFTPEHKRVSAIMAIRLSKKPNTMLVVTNDDRDATNWVKTYMDKGISTHVYLVDKDWFYTGEDYLAQYTGELLLDAVMRNRHSTERPLLEEIAESFSQALGWSFSGPIREQALTPDYLDKFQARDVLPYAGWKGNYGFAATIRQLNDTLIEDEAPGGKLSITPSHRTRLLVGKACTTQELIDFRDYLMAIIDNDVLAESLEAGWVLCSCGHPVRQFGPIEAATCLYCDAEIEGFYCTDVDMPYTFVKLYAEARKELARK
jgi:hypothetical protein